MILLFIDLNARTSKWWDTSCELWTNGKRPDSVKLYDAMNFSINSAYVKILLFDILDDGFRFFSGSRFYVDRWFLRGNGFWFDPNLVWVNEFLLVGIYSWWQNTSNHTASHMCVSQSSFIYIQYLGGWSMKIKPKFFELKSKVEYFALKIDRMSFIRLLHTHKAASENKQNKKREHFVLNNVDGVTKDGATEKSVTFDRIFTRVFFFLIFYGCFWNKGHQREKQNVEHTHFILVNYLIYIIIP